MSIPTCDRCTLSGRCAAAAGVPLDIFMMREVGVFGSTGAAAAADDDKSNAFCNEGLVMVVITIPSIPILMGVRVGIGKPTGGGLGRG
jgi:hypothetical protein